MKMTIEPGFTDPSEPGRSAPTPSSVPQGTVAALGGLFLLTLFFFWPTLASFHPVWTSYNYSHGYLILGFVGFFVLRERRAFLAGHQPLLSPLAVLALIGLSAFWLVTTVMNVRVFYQASLPLVIFFWTVIVFGRRAVPVFGPVLAIFLLAVPFWEILNLPLQLITANVSGLVLHALRIPVEIRGDLVTIPAGSFFVADACSGLRQFLVALVVASIYSMLFLRRRRSRVKVVLLGIVLALVANWVRVTTIILIGHVSQMQSGFIQEHYTLGWLIFSLSLIPFFLLARMIEKRERAFETSGRELPAPRPGPLSPASIPEVPDPGPSSILTRAILASALAVSGPLLYWGMNALPRAHEDGVVPSGALQASAWERQQESPARSIQWQPAYLGGDEHQTGTFTNGVVTLFLDRLLYRHQVQGGELVYYENRIAPDSALVAERMVGPLGSDGRWVRQALVATPEGMLMVLYWFRVGGVDTAFPPWAKVLEVLAFFRRTPASELVSISALCGPSDCEAAEAGLLDFLGRI